MQNIFLSRPTWINKPYEQGLETFITVLKAHKLNPCTIGTTDYPNQSPLDDVINLMQKCKGVIVLGYPQININSGQIKKQTVTTPISLGTEWNHIEAALAYSLHLPLLIIRDEILTPRGIFDKGTLNSFIYSIDMTTPTWAINDITTGAIDSWIKRF